MKLPHDTITLPLPEGTFAVFGVPSRDAPSQLHLVFANERWRGDTPPLVRVHSECFTGDTFGSLRCDCNAQLHRALQMIGQDGGVLIYLRQEGRGVGLANKFAAYRLQEQGYDTVDAQHQLNLPVDGRVYDEAADILRNLDILQVRLMTNNPDKIKDLEKHGVEVVERIPLIIPPTKHSKKYLQTKKEKLHHLFDDDAA